VGSARSISIAELANLVRQLVTNNIEITNAKLADPALPAQRYVPSIERARSELALDTWISLEEAINKYYDSIDLV
jgi:dTDP-glucose 4,6-dehydratase